MRYIKTREKIFVNLGTYLKLLKIYITTLKTNCHAYKVINT